MKKHTFWVAIAALLALVSAACGSASDDGEATAEVSSGDTAEASADAADDAESRSDDTEASDGESSATGTALSDSSASTPADGDDASSENTSDDGDTVATSAEDMTVDEITELLFPTFDENSIADQEAQWQDQERQSQALIAECMAEQGFEYIPVDYSSQISFGGVDEGLDYESREYAEIYGFGYFTWDLFGEEEAFEEGAGDFVDPNQAYVDGLSEGAQQAYYDALYGEQPDFSGLSEEEIDQMYEDNPEMFQPQGCQGEAFEATNEFAQMQDVYLALEDAFEELYQRVESDPRVAAWQREWAECMSGKGHTFATVDEIYEALNERWETVYNFDDYQDPWENYTEEEIAALSEEELDELFKGPEPDAEALAEAQEWEIALAVDNFDCGGTSQWETFEEIFEEYQETFIEENLDTIRAALAAG